MSGFKLRQLVAKYGGSDAEMPPKGSKEDLRVRIAFQAVKKAVDEGYRIDSIAKVILFEAPDGTPGRLEIAFINKRR
jgi:hypothetical protein